MVSKSQIKAITKYEKKAYDKVLLRLPKGTRDAIKEKASERGESMNEFIVKAIKERM